MILSAGCWEVGAGTVFAPLDAGTALARAAGAEFAVPST